MQQLEITAITVRTAGEFRNPKTRAEVAIMLNGRFLVAGIRVVQGKAGLFVSWPASCNPEGKDWEPIAKPALMEDLADMDGQIMRVYLESVAAPAEVVP